jgi:hypothetical protein
METSGNLFKKQLDKAFNDPSIKLNSSTMGDAMKYKQSFKEEKIEGGLADGKTFMDVVKKHSKGDSVDPSTKKKIKDIFRKIKIQLNKGIKVEMEHTKSRIKAKEIAMDHLWEDPKYYDKLEKIESKEGKDKKYLDIEDMVPELRRQLNKNTMFDKDKKKEDSPKKKETKEATGSGSVGAYSAPVFGGNDEFWEKSRSENPKLEEQLEKVEATEATGSGSVGGYETPAMWAKSTKKKDWGPSRKTQIPGGGFVKIKKKCTKFPYCNQGDISNLKISKNESVKNAIKSVSNKLGISESTIITILEHEYEKSSKRTK